MNKYYVPLDDWIEIRISGPQKVEYLNGIITRDLLKIQEGEVARSAFLTPNAKIRSVYWLKQEEDAIFFYCPGSMKEALVEDLLKYKLNMDVKLEDITDETDPLYLISSDMKIPGLSNEEVGFEFHHATDSPEGEELTEDKFVDFLVKHNITPPHIMEGHNPYEIGIEDAISLEKGCFLGQEPISRMYHRGNPRKYVYKVRFPSEEKTEKITKEDEEVGQLLISTTEGDGFVGLSYLRRTLDDHSGLQLGSSSLKVIDRVGNYPKNDR